VASPTRDARLRIKDYVPIPKGPGGTSGQDLILRLQATRIQKDLTDGASILSYVGYNPSDTLSYSIVQFIITVTGIVIDDVTHTAHPLTTGVEHVPDFIDLEEAAIAWNNQASNFATDPDKAPQLEIQYDGANWRVYKGAILSMVLKRTAGHVAVDFTLQFAVAWSLDNPTLREWIS
jgi:hypothetical protein